MKILSVSSGRADAGILAPVWQTLAAMTDVDLHILLTGMHTKKTPEAVNFAGLENATIHRSGTDLGGGAGSEAGLAMADISRSMTRLCSSIDPDNVILIGDRLDMIPVALGSLPFNIPLIHIHGGELSLGSIDDRNRHAMTKLSHLHCAANVSAAARICQMGEEPWRVRVTGAPGLDTLLAAEQMTEDVFAATCGLPSTKGLRLVTVHPETNTANPAAVLDPILEALDSQSAPTLFTASNADPDGDAMDRKIQTFAAKRDWAVYRGSLGSQLYPNALRLASVALGNSSSGIIEAALFGLNAINVGIRQEGREKGANVHDCPAQADKIAELLNQFTTTATGVPENSLYGDGCAAPRIADFILSAPDRNVLLDKKFHSGPASFHPPWVNGALA